MPVYNGALFLEDAIRSVLEQTYLNWELIIVDDGSTDNSLRIAKAFKGEYEKIKVLQHEGRCNKGVSASRNMAIREAKGNWIALLDADDKWFPGKLKKEAEIIEKHPDVVLLYSKAEKIYSDTSFDQSVTSVYGSGKNGEISNPFKRLLPGFITSTSAVTFKKEIFLKCGGFNEKLNFSEDTLLFHQLMEHGNVYCIDEILSTHRIHRTSVVSNTSVEKRVVSRYIVYEQLLSRVKEENIPLVSAALVSTGLLKIFRSFILYPANRFDIVFEYLNKTLINSNVLVRHKIKAIFMLIREILIAPVKSIWLKIK